MVQHMNAIKLGAMFQTAGDQLINKVLSATVREKFVVISSLSQLQAIQTVIKELAVRETVSQTLQIHALQTMEKEVVVFIKHILAEELVSRSRLQIRHVLQVVLLF